MILQSEKVDKGEMTIGIWKAIAVETPLPSLTLSWNVSN